MNTRLIITMAVPGGRGACEGDGDQEEVMQVLVRNQRTHMFLTVTGEWNGEDAQSACDFHTCLHALEAAMQTTDEAAEIYYRFRDGSYDFALPIEQGRVPEQSGLRLDK